MAVISSWKYFRLDGELKRLYTVSTMWDRFTTWWHYKHSCILLLDNSDVVAIVNRFYWLVENVGEPHEEWRWAVDGPKVVDTPRYRVACQVQFYFKNGEDMTLFLLRWS